MSVFEIPLKPSTPQELLVTLGNRIQYRFRLDYRKFTETGWILDISDVTGVPLACGIPLVTGANLIEQYPDLTIPGSLYCVTDADFFKPPTFNNLGVSSHLYYEF